MVARKPLFLAALLVSAALATTTVGQAATHRDSIAPAASSTTVVKAQAARSTHHFRGNVVSRNRSRRWFRMHTTTRRSLRIYTNQRTSWGEDCDWGDMRYVDVHVGEPGEGRVAYDTYGGYGVTISGISRDRDAWALLARGVGGRRKMGAGWFDPA